MNQILRPPEHGAVPARDVGWAPRRLPEHLLRGWTLLGRARHGEGAPAGEDPRGCHVLAHPLHGVTLLDIAPTVTADAEALFRRTLDGAGFAERFPGAVPVWHLRLDAARLPVLPALLEEVFSRLPALAPDSAGEWVLGLHDALAADPAWMTAAANAPPPPAGSAVAPDIPAESAAATPVAAPALPAGAAQARGGAALGRAALILSGIAAIFFAGVVVGKLLPPSADPGAGPGQQMRSLSVPFVAPAAGLLPDQLPTAGLPPPPGAAPMVDVAEASPMATGDEIAAPVLATSVPEGPLPSLPIAAVIPRDDAEARPPRPAARSAPPRPVAPRRPAPTQDQRCMEAQFRWQQGARLTAAEMAHVREGCALAALRRR
jgi:hypothetical protein